jgi:hypothetical protein
MAKTLNYEKIKTDMKDWPKRWAGGKSDIPVGDKIVQSMEPFLLAMKEDGLAVTTINRHLTHLWLLGGEIIYRVQDEPEMRKASGSELLLEFVDDEGGPLSKHLSTEEEQKPFDGTCRKLYRFLKKEPNSSV